MSGPPSSFDAQDFSSHLECYMDLVVPKVDPGPTPNVPTRQSVLDESQWARIQAISPPKEVLNQFPGRRYNYFDVPWTASTLSEGAFVLSNEDLSVLDLAYSGKFFLQLSTFRRGLPTEVHTFGPLYATRAEVLWGQHSGASQYDWIAVGNGQSYTNGDQPSNYPNGAVWEVRFSDERVIARWKPAQASYNVHDATGRRYYRRTTKNDTQPWSAKEVIDNIATMTELTTEWTEKLPDANDKITDMTFRGIPSPVALDLALARIGYVARPWFQNGVFKLYLEPWADLDTFEGARTLSVSLDTIKNYRIHGSLIRQYRRPNVPRQLGFMADAIPSQGHLSLDPAATDTEANRTKITAVTLQGTGTVPGSQFVIPQPILEFGQASLTAYRTQFTKAMRQTFDCNAGRMTYIGWWGLIFNAAGWSMVTFELSGSTPLTSVEFASHPPAGRLTLNRLEDQQKGLPIPVAVARNGHVCWQMSPEGHYTIREAPRFFLGRVIERDEAGDTTGGNNRGTVKPIIDPPANWYNDPNQLYLAPVSPHAHQAVNGVWLWEESWIAEGDPVLCFWTGLDDPRWVAVHLPPVRVPGRWCEPGPSCLCENVDPCDPCTQTAHTAPAVAEVPKDA